MSAVKALGTTGNKGQTRQNDGDSKKTSGCQGLVGRRREDEQTEHIRYLGP